MAWMQIDTTNASIEITSRRAQLNIQTQRPEMRIHRKPAEMHIERKAPVMHIDWDPYNAQVGMDKPLAMSRRLTQQADYKARQGISRIVSDGNRLSEINGVSHADLSYEHMMERDKVTLGHITSRAQPIVDWDAGNITINWNAHEMDIEWDIKDSPIITVDPYEVEIRMRNYPSVKIRLTEEYYESLSGRGRKLDKKV